MRKDSRLSVMVLSGCLVCSGAAMSVSQAWALMPVPISSSQQDEKKDEKKKSELTLEKLFPDQSYWGPSAGSVSFSHDGRYAAYLYRPYKERRHGSDLWVFDTKSGEAKRLTMVSVMSEFQAGTREVKEYRNRKAKEAAAKQKAGGAAKPAADRPDDGVSGTWEGLVKGSEDFGIPPEGLAFTLEIELQDGGSVIGVMKMTTTTANLSEAKYDASTKTIKGKLVDPQFGTAGTLTLTVADGGELRGSIVSEEFGVSLTVEGKRTKQLESGAESAGADGKQTDGNEKIDTESGDWVGEEDADDRRAPRYVGISSYVWSPNGHEMIFTSAGDLYRMELDGAKITRLTMTNEFEGGADYLPDGSGYTYTRNNALMRVRFGSHLVEQIDPRLPGDENMSRYELSPDGTRAVVVTSKGPSFWTEGRTVNIARYRGRFMEVQTVRRHVSDDPLPTSEWNVYLFEINDTATEQSELAKVFTAKVEGPRDALPSPNWAPDSSRVAFSNFDQHTGQVRILEARFPDRPKNEEGKEGEESAKEKPAEKGKIGEAVVVYQFYHNGGPNTPNMIQPMYLPDSRQMTFITEQSGYRQLHILDPLYQALDQVTTGRFEVYPFDQSEDHRYIFATATKASPAQEDVYKIDLVERTMERLSPIDGDFTSAAVSDDGQHVLGNFVRYGQLRELVYVNVAKKEQKQITDSHPPVAHEVTEPVPEFFTFNNRHGHELHGVMFKPDGWTKDDKRPLLIYVYGGPLGTRKEVKNGSYSSNAYFFAYYMAKKHGYVTCTIDTRGMSGYGGLFEKSNFEQVGKPQVEDLVDGAKWFAENMGVDAKRVGLHGWSFGGFQTQMCLYTQPGVFAAGIAGAGPTEWENYNSWYTQGTIGETRSGTPDLQKYSLLPLAKNLKDELLLVHGMEDSNVLYQDTVRVYRELLQAGKETLVELFLDPTGGHGLGGDVKTLNRYRKYEEFLLRHLGREVQEETAAEGDQAEGDDSA